MSNRTDYDHLAKELGEAFALPKGAVDRIAIELHNAHVAGLESVGFDGHTVDDVGAAMGCLCLGCKRIRGGAGK